jgi:hypothetical protein
MSGCELYELKKTTESVNGAGQKPQRIAQHS